MSVMNSYTPVLMRVAVTHWLAVFCELTITSIDAAVPPAPTSVTLVRRTR
jgi:hypothetical protein